MKIRKKPIVKERVRRPPKAGWSWIDRRFLREYAELLEPDALVLYFFLAAVSDKEGLSYYSDAGISRQLRISESSVAKARDELEFHELIAYQAPLYQVLSLPSCRKSRIPRGQSSPMLIGEIMRQLAGEDGIARRRTET